jgi:hypothetical protein
MDSDASTVIHLLTTGLVVRLGAPATEVGRARSVVVPCAWVAAGAGFATGLAHDGGCGVGPVLGHPQIAAKDSERAGGSRAAKRSRATPRRGALDAVGSGNMIPRPCGDDPGKRRSPAAADRRRAVRALVVPSSSILLSGSLSWSWSCSSNRSAPTSERNSRLMAGDRDRPSTGRRTGPGSDGSGRTGRVLFVSAVRASA